MSSLANSYGAALFEVTRKRGKTSEVLQTLSALAESLERNQDLFEAFKSPLISDGDKRVLIERALGPGMTDELEVFFEILAKNNRLSELLRVIRAFETMSSVDSGVMTGVVESAVELTDLEKSEVKKTMEKQLSHPVKLQFRIKPELIGGIEARVGDYLFEDSIKSHIKRMNDFVG